jgi:hypothetical protein
MVRKIPVADQPLVPAGRAGKGTGGGERLPFVADQPLVPAGQAGEGTGRVSDYFVADQPGVPARQAGRGPGDRGWWLAATKSPAAWR